MKTLAYLLPLLATSVLVAPAVHGQPAPSGEVVEALPDEAPGGVFRVGAGFSTTERFLLSTGIGHDRLFGVDGHQLWLDARLSALRQDAEMRWGLAGPLLPFDVELRAHHDRLALTLDGEGIWAASTGGLLELGLRLARAWRLAGWYELDGLALEDSTGAGAREPLPGSEGLRAAVGLSLAYHSPLGWDTPSGVRRGLHLTASARRADPLLGSEFAFTRLEAQAGYGLLLPLGFTVSLNARGGQVLGEAGSVPLHDRFRLGAPWGPGTSLGWEVAGSDALLLGGEGMLFGRAELGIPLWRKFGLYAFGGAEAGAITRSQATPLRRVSGVAGLLWNSPLGPLRAGWAMPLSQEAGPKQPSTLHFAIGSGF